MFRDFSQKAREDLKGYAQDVGTPWYDIVDFFQDWGIDDKKCLSEVQSEYSIEKVNEYHKLVLDKNDTTAKEIDEIFNAVEAVDTQYLDLTSELSRYGEKIKKLIVDMGDMIDPNGGNLSIEKMDSVLAADIEALDKAQATAATAIEEELYGMGPEAAEMSPDPVNLSTGNFAYDHKDLEIGGEIPLIFHRYYNSKDTRVGALGKCFLHNYEVAVEEDAEGNIGVRLTDGQLNHYEKTIDGKYIGKTLATEDLEKTKDGYILTKPGKERRIFNAEGKIIRQENWNGRGISFSYNEKMQLVEAVTDTGSKLCYAYDEATGYLVSVEDHTGRKVELSYVNGNLDKAVLPLGITYTYKYGTNGRIVELINSRDVSAVKNEYDNRQRVTHQLFPDGGTMSFEYDDKNRRVTMTERNGVKTTYVHDDRYRNVETIYEDGTSEKFIYNERNQCISKTDRNGRTERMAYDNRGNMTQHIDALKKRVNLTYDAYNNLVSISINGKERVTNFYDAKGNLTGTRNLNGDGVFISYNENSQPLEITAADGGKISLTYDERDNLVSIVDGFGAEIKYRYDELNRVTETTDANGNITKFERDAADRVTKVVNPLGAVREYQYNPSGRVTQMKDFDGYVTDITYNAIGKVESVTDKEKNTVTYAYDKMWNMISQIMPNGVAHEFIYNKDNRLSEVHMPNQGVLLYTYDAVGNRTSMTDAEGNTTAFIYDVANRLTERIEPDGVKTVFGYDREGNLVTITDALGNVTAYTYDDLGRRTSVTNAEGHTTSVVYNAMGKVERVCYPNGSQSVYSYELGGRVKGVKNPDGSSETYEYDRKGNLISRKNGLGDKVSFRYDELDRIIAIVNPLGGERSFSYDVMGHITEIIDEKGNKTAYEYTPNGNLSKVVDALGNETFYEYDVMGNLVKSICTGINGEEEQGSSYVWDAIGNITSVTDPLGAVESYLYDKNGNMTSKTDRDGYETVFTYGRNGMIEEILYADGQKVSMSYDALRRLQEVKDNLGVTSVQIDKLGRTLSVTDSYGKTIGYEWGSMNEKTAVIYPDGKRAEYEYNDAMQLVALQTGNGVIRYGYDEIGRIKEKILPNGVTTSYRYNALGRVEEIVHKGAEVYESYRYAFDAYGNKVGAEKKRQGNEADNGKFTYVYDVMSRLSEVRQNGELLRKYTYDAFGNRTQKAEYVNGAENLTSYVYNVNNQLMSEADAAVTKNYSYDHRGNLLKVTAGEEILKEFAFDATNRMTSSMGIVDGMQKRASYKYNGLGHRMEQSFYGASIVPDNPEKRIRYTIDMTRQYYNLLQTSGESRESQTYYWDGNVVSMEAEGEENFYLQDDLGSPMQLLDMNGITREKYAFDEFGLMSGIELGSKQVFGFTGYQMDEAGGLYYAQARRYDANVGRFVSEDKVRGFIAFPYTLNHYTYCWNDPEDFKDMDGNWVTIAIGAGVGALAGGLMSIGADIVSGNEIDWGNAGKTALAGAVAGGLIGTGVGAGAGATLMTEACLAAGVSGAIGGVTSGASNMMLGGTFADGAVGGTVNGIIVGATSVLLPGADLVANFAGGAIGSVVTTVSSTENMADIDWLDLLGASVASGFTQMVTGGIIGKMIPSNLNLGTDIYGKTASGFVKYVEESLGFSGSFVGDAIYGYVSNDDKNIVECEVSQ